MAANPNVVPDGGSGAGSSPSEPVSPQSQPAIDGDAIKLLARLGEQVTTLETQLRGLQGRQDKSENTLRSQLARLNQYKQGGLSEEEALAKMDADDASSRWRQDIDKKLNDVLTFVQSGGTQMNNQQLVATALNSYGLDPKDPFVAGRLQGQNPRNDTEAELLAARIFRDKASAPPTNPSQQSAAPGVHPSGGLTPEVVEQKSQQLLRLYDNASANAPQIAILEKEIKEYWATQT